MSTCLDIAPLLRPLAADAPCGEDLEYGADFAALMAAAAGKAEQQLGDVVVPAVAPDWPAAIALATQLLERGRDLRVACRLAQALLHVEGLPGLRDGLALVRGCVEQWWDALYPRLDVEDGFDPAIRVNALALLCHPAALVLPLREVALLRSASGRAICLNAITQGTGHDEAADEDTLAEATEIEAAFAGAAPAQLQALADTAQEAHAAACAIEAALMRHVGAARALDFEALTRPLADIAAIATQWLERRATASAPDGTAEGVGPEVEEAPRAVTSAPQAMPEPAPVGAAGEVADGEVAAAPLRSSTLEGVRDRADVLRCLDGLCRWFREHEPSHPAPLLLERARRWVEMDFMSLLRDLSPQAVEDAERLRGAAAAD